MVLPLGSICALLAAPAVRLLYGDRWLQVIPLIPWGAAVDVVGALTRTAYVLSLAAHHKQRCLVADAGVLLGTGLALLILLPHSPQAYLSGLCVIQLSMLFFLWQGLCPARSKAYAFLLLMLAKPISALLCAWAICEAVRHLLGAPRDHAPTAVVYATGFGVMYMAVLRIWFTDQFHELVRHLPGQRHINRLFLRTI